MYIYTVCIYMKIRIVWFFETDYPNSNWESKNSKPSFKFFLSQE